MECRDFGTLSLRGSAYIIAPCHSRGVWCRTDAIKVCGGDYACRAWVYTDRYAIGGQMRADTLVGVIGIYLNGDVPAQRAMEKASEIGADAGLTGFVSCAVGYGIPEWDAIRGVSANGYAWLTPEGFFGRTGHGAGCYGVYVYRQGGRATALEVRFL